MLDVPLSKPRRERFAQLVAIGMRHERAYIAAGYRVDNAASAAASLLRDPRVAARVERLRSAAPRDGGSRHVG